MALTTHPHITSPLRFVTCYRVNFSLCNDNHINVSRLIILYIGLFTIYSLFSCNDVVTKEISMSLLEDIGRLCPVLLILHVVAQLVEALRYKPEGRGFDFRWCHWNFSLI